MSSSSSSASAVSSKKRWVNRVKSCGNALQDVMCNVTKLDEPLDQQDVREVLACSERVVRRCLAVVLAVRSSRLKEKTPDLRTGDQERDRLLVHELVNAHDRHWLSRRPELDCAISKLMRTMWALSEEDGLVHLPEAQRRAENAVAIKKMLVQKDDESGDYAGVHEE